METDIFGTYWRQVLCELFGDRTERTAISKTDAIGVHQHPEVWAHRDGAQVVRLLFDALDCAGWTDQGSNWRWNTAHGTSPKNASPEVLLEHRVVELGRSAWARQMATASGVNRRADGRRSPRNRKHPIDLVHYFPDTQSLLFVELKVEANNPLYAIFEVLGYGLAYLHARNSLSAAMRGDPNIMSAKTVELLVLGPRAWYSFRTRSGRTESYDFRGLLHCLNDGLRRVSEGNPEMVIRCAMFDLDEPARSVMAAPQIVDRSWAYCW